MHHYAGSIAGVKFSFSRFPIMRAERALHNGATAELLHIAERKRSNASSVKAERGMWQMKQRLRAMKHLAAVPPNMKRASGT